MKKIEIIINGMSCKSCVLKIQKVLLDEKAIKKADVNLSSKKAHITYDEELITYDEIKAIINKEGYLVKKENNFWILILAIISFVIFVNNPTWFSFIPEIKPGMSYFLLFVVGLLTSFHCVAMCGGINLSVVIGSKHNKTMSGLNYNLGRVFAYTIIGGVIGGLGSILAINNEIRNILYIIVGFIMLLLGLKILGVMKNIPLNIELPNFLSSKIRKIKQKVNSPFIIGVLNGFMPCGPLQTMQIYALGTASLFVGALSMLFFALGTVPMMLALSFIGGRLTADASLKIKKISALIIIVLGLVMLSRGIDFSLFNKNINIPKDAYYAKLNGDYQELTTRFKFGEYQTIVVEENIPVIWKIVIKPGDLNSCNNTLVIEKLNIKKDLVFGENIVKFTPTKTGVITYSCWMNMIRDKIIVVEDIKKISKT